VAFVLVQQDPTGWQALFCGGVLLLVHGLYWLSRLQIAANGPPGKRKAGVRLPDFAARKELIVDQDDTNSTREVLERFMSRPDSPPEER
jgi:hypothetical protein